MLTKFKNLFVSRRHPTLSIARFLPLVLSDKTLSCSGLWSFVMTTRFHHSQRRFLVSSQSRRNIAEARKLTEQKATYNVCSQFLDCGTSIRKYAKSARKSSSSKSVQVVDTEDKPFSELTTSQKVARAGRDTWYFVIVICGVATLGGITYIIGRELFSNQTPNGVYTKALKECLRNTEIEDTLGTPIKGYGETTSRGRRRYTRHQEFMVDGVKHMRMRFYIQGPNRKGTVHLEVKQNDGGRYEYRYLFVELDGYPQRTIVLEDNQ